MGRHELELYTRAHLEQRAEVDRLYRVYSDAITKWGPTLQMRMAQEECAELIAVINHVSRGRVGFEALAGEVADVEIMCAQLRQIVGNRLVEEAKKQKLERLAERIGAPHV